MLRTALWLWYKRDTPLPFDVHAQQGLFNATDICRLIQKGGYLSRPRTMYALLIALREFDVLDPKDHVYALLGLHQHFIPAATDRKSLLAPD